MTLYEVCLDKVGDKKKETIAVICKVSNCGQTYAKCMVETVPVVVAGGLNKKDAEFLRGVFIFLGNTATIKKDYNTTEEMKIFDRSLIRRTAGMLQDMETGPDLEKPYSGHKTNDLTKSGKSNSTGSGITLKEQASSVRVIQPKKSALLKIAFVSCAVALFIVACALGIKDASKGARKPTSSQEKEVSKPDKESSKPNKDSEKPSNNSSNKTNDESQTEAVPRKGTIAEEIVRDAFGKEVEEVTRSELDMVVGVELDTGSEICPVMRYELADGKQGAFLCAYSEYDVQDILCFRNLEKLHGKYKHSKIENFDAFPHLRELTCELDSFKSVSSYCNGENLEVLDVKIDFFGSFRASDVPNVEKLTVRCDRNDTPGNLKIMKNLKSLTLLDADRIDDFNFLFELTGLEELYIQSSALKTIDYITKMPNLKSFGIENTRVKDLSKLKDFTGQLTQLHLIDNYEVQDYSVVEEMTQLERLSLVPGYGEPNTIYSMPDLSKSAGIKELCIGIYDDCSALAALKNLEILRFERIYDNFLDGICGLENLKEIHFHDGSVFSQEILNAASCPNLERVCFENAFIWEDLSYILNMPSIRSLNMKRATAGLDMRKLNDNANLQLLDLTSSRLEKLLEDGSWDYEGRVVWCFPELAELLEHYKSLRVLKVPGYDIDNLEWLEGCIGLEILNINNNYVTDLSPISKLPIRRIYCHDNPIYEMAGLEETMVK